MNTKIKIISLALLSVTLVTLFGFQEDRKNFEVSKNIDIFNSVFKELSQYYVDTIQAEKVIKGAIDNMLENLDPYTEYIPESESDQLKFLTTGEYGGIGSLISYRIQDSAILINEVYEHTPAAKNALKSGDKLLEIDGISMKGKMTQDASNLLKGKIGTSVKIKLEREGSKKPIEKEIMREKIQINPVSYYGMVDDNTGYIYASTFNDKTADEVKKAFVDLKQNHGMKALVLDLRGNTGGLLDEAIKMVNFFVPKGKEVLSTKGKLKQWDQTFRTSSTPLDENIPLAVLVNGESASASEIVSGALQDLDRAVIIGNRTYGKGLVQSVRSVAYNGRLKLTTAKYYIPSGRCIQEIDYSLSRNKASGELVKIPDSLTHEFTTSTGRKVRDGKGILPDFVNEPEKVKSIMLYLLKDYHIMLYAAKYLRENTDIPAVKDFHLSDKAYKEFGDYLKAHNFTYDQQSVKELEALKKLADFEGYGEEIKEEYEQMKTKLTPNLDKDLQTSRKEIQRLIEMEIIKQHYFQSGAIQYTLTHDDKDLQKALEVLNNPELYKKTLNI